MKNGVKNTKTAGYNTVHLVHYVLHGYVYGVNQVKVFKFLVYSVNAHFFKSYLFDLKVG